MRPLPAARTCCSSTGERPMRRWPLQALTRYGLDIPAFGMVKDDRHRTRALVHPDGREIGIQAVPALFAFIGQIQEETHRSAVGFHHKRHTKSGLGSTLERIPGIGGGPAEKAAEGLRQREGHPSGGPAGPGGSSPQGGGPGGL